MILSYFFIILIFVLLILISINIIFQAVNFNITKIKGGGGKCKYCKKYVNDLFTCSRCNTAKYCSATCQKQDWTEHKLECEKIAQQNIITAKKDKEQKKFDQSESNKLAIRAQIRTVTPLTPNIYDIQFGQIQTNIRNHIINKSYNDDINLKTFIYYANSIHTPRINLNPLTNHNLVNRFQEDGNTPVIDLLSIFKNYRRILSSNLPNFSKCGTLYLAKFIFYDNDTVLSRLFRNDLTEEQFLTHTKLRDREQIQDYISSDINMFDRHDNSEELSFNIFKQSCAINSNNVQNARLDTDYVKTLPTRGITAIIEMPNKKTPLSEIVVHDPILLPYNMVNTGINLPIYLHLILLNRENIPNPIFIDLYIYKPKKIIDQTIYKWKAYSSRIKITGMRIEELITQSADDADDADDADVDDVDDADDVDVDDVDDADNADNV
jgi:hypothetical protein